MIDHKDYYNGSWVMKNHQLRLAPSTIFLYGRLHLLPLLLRCLLFILFYFILFFYNRKKYQKSC